jgi:hypothetical protein
VKATAAALLHAAERAEASSSDDWIKAHLEQIFFASD